MSKAGKWFYYIGIGVAMGFLFLVLQWSHYRFLLASHRFEVYALMLGVVFTGVGIWAGRQLVGKKVEVVEKIVEKEVVVEKEVPARPLSITRQELMQKTALSEREAEVLELIVAGLSNQEIADRLFLSLSTVKTHVSNIFLKLEVTRRTQAIQAAREMGL
jgi:DNA-binding CsgD family transcriptional regulator